MGQTWMAMAHGPGSFDVEAPKHACPMHGAEELVGFYGWLEFYEWTIWLDLCWVYVGWANLCQPHLGYSGYLRIGWGFFLTIRRLDLMFFLTIWKAGVPAAQYLWLVVFENKQIGSSGHLVPRDRNNIFWGGMFLEFVWFCQFCQQGAEFKDSHVDGCKWSCGCAASICIVPSLVYWWYMYIIYLVGGLEHFLFSIYGMSSLTHWRSASFFGVPGRSNFRPSLRIRPGPWAWSLTLRPLAALGRDFWRVPCEKWASMINPWIIMVW